MKKQIIKIISISLFFLLSSSSSALAALQSVPVPQYPQNQRDLYQTDKFTGSAVYSYPIKVPKGTNGLTPDVFLSYDHQAAHALPMSAGLGWELNLDYIQRDVNFTPSSTGDDKYILHFKGATHKLVYQTCS